MKKKMFEACGGWILTEVLLLVTAWTSHLVLVWIAAVLMVGLVFLTWGLGFYVRNHLEAEIQIPVTADKRQKKAGTLVIKNDSRIPVMHLYGELEVKNGLTDERSLLEISMTVPSGGTAEENFEICSEHCGYLRVQIHRLWIMDWFGILPFPVSCSGNSKMSVLPDTFSTQVSLELPFYQTD